MNHIVGMTQMGIRNVSSSNRDDYEAAHAAGSKVLSVRVVHPDNRTGSGHVNSHGEGVKQKQQ